MSHSLYSELHLNIARQKRMQQKVKMEKLNGTLIIMEIYIYTHIYLKNISRCNDIKWKCSQILLHILSVGTYNVYSIFSHGRFNGTFSN